MNSSEVSFWLSCVRQSLFTYQVQQLIQYSLVACRVYEVPASFVKGVEQFEAGVLVHGAHTHTFLLVADTHAAQLQM